MKIAIYSKFYVEKSRVAIETLLAILNKKPFDFALDKDFYDHLKPHLNTAKTYATFSKLDASYDLLISIGGDGTILRAITLVKHFNIPVVGINTGRLGFLATIKTDYIELAMEQIFKGEYTVSERSLLQIETNPPNKAFETLNFALNEVAISRKNTTSMITVDTKLNNEYLTSYWSDGLIIATPTGSTGYSLSCGGPVITPDASSLVITPIAPHNLSARPLVIEDSTEITLEVNGRENQYLVSLDSRIATLDNDTVITLKKAPFKIKMITLNNESFLDTLRKKLLWGEDKRN